MTEEEDNQLYKAMFPVMVKSGTSTTDSNTISKNLFSTFTFFL